MTPQPSDEMETTQIDSPKQRKLWAIGIVCLIVILLVGSLIWMNQQHREISLDILDSIPLKGLDSNVSAFISNACNDVRNNPYSDQTWGRLAMILAAHQFHEEANRCFQIAEQLNSNEFLWPYLQGHLATVQDQTAAIQHFERCTQLHPNSVLSHLRLGELLLELKQNQRAKKILQTADRLDPGNPRVQLALARLALINGDLNLSLKLATQSAKRAKQKRAPFELLARIQMSLKNESAAEAQLQILATLPPGPTTWPDPFVLELENLRRDPDALLERVEEFMQTGQLQEALRLLTRIVDEHPDVPVYQIRLVRVLLGIEKNELASKVLDRALELHPESSELNRLRGLVYVRSGDLENAANQFRQAITLKRDHTPAYFNLGETLLKLNDRGAALDAFQQAVRCQSNLTDAHHIIAELLLEKGEQEAARKHLETVLEYDPKNQKSQNLLKTIPNP
ncbi:MAG: tetratricopeptide repeat protein [Gimesia sp.]